MLVIDSDGLAFPSGHVFSDSCGLAFSQLLAFTGGKFPEFPLHVFLPGDGFGLV